MQGKPSIATRWNNWNGNPSIYWRDSNSVCRGLHGKVLNKGEILNRTMVARNKVEDAARKKYGKVYPLEQP